VKVFGSAVVMFSPILFVCLALVLATKYRVSMLLILLLFSHCAFL